MTNYKFIFYDFEVKKDWWCCTFGEPKIVPPSTTEQLVYTTVTDKLSLMNYILKNKDTSIFMGYNNVHFDNYCLKAVWYDVNPYVVVDHCIKKGEQPWNIPELKFKKNIQMNCFDLMRVLGRMAPPLKEIEGNLGIEIIIDKTIANEKEEKLTEKELKEIIEYNKHDVYATWRLFKEIKYEYDTMMLLIDYYQLPLQLLTKSKASVLENIYKKDIKEHENPATFKYKAPSFIKMKDEQVKNAMESFEFTEDNSFGYEYEVDGEIYKIGRGGAHYAKKNLYIKLEKGKTLVCADFGSFYPNMAANKTNPELRYIDGSLDWTKFRGMIDLRMEEKKKGTKLAGALKIPLNGAYGKLIDKFSPLYNWSAGLSICLTGQLITIMICQKLNENKIGNLVNVNTDGFYYIIDSEDKLKLFEDIMKEFETVTGIGFSFDVIKNGVFAQKDVNNYVIADFDTKHIKVKGGMVTRFDANRLWFQYSQAIVDEAVVNKLVYDKPIRDTILEAYNKNEAVKFQIITNMRGKNWEGCFLCWSKDTKEIVTAETTYTDQPIKEIGKVEEVQRINRLFAVCDNSAPRLGKLKEGTYNKFANTPNHIIIYNGDLKDLDIRKIGLNIEWYCKLAEKRVEAFLGK